jgi:hypothetical protein
VRFTKLFAEYEAFQKMTFESEFKASKLWVEGDAYNQKHIFQLLASVKKNAAGKWVFNPGLTELCGENSVEEFLILMYRPFASSKLFGAFHPFSFIKTS